MQGLSHRLGGYNAFPNDIDKACALCHAIISNHPFVDGNKRTGAAVLGMVLRANSIDFAPDHREFYSTMMGVASSAASLEELTAWVASNMG